MFEQTGPPGRFLCGGAEQGGGLQAGPANYSDRRRGDETLDELVRRHDAHSNQINDWKNLLLEWAAGVFGGEAAEPSKTDLRGLHTPG